MFQVVDNITTSVNRVQERVQEFCDLLVAKNALAPKKLNLSPNLKEPASGSLISSASRYRFTPTLVKNNFIN